MSVTNLIRSSTYSDRFNELLSIAFKRRSNAILTQLEIIFLVILSTYFLFVKIKTETVKRIGDLDRYCANTGIIVDRSNRRSFVCINILCFPSKWDAAMQERCPIMNELIDRC